MALVTSRPGLLCDPISPTFRLLSLDAAIVLLTVKSSEVDGFLIVPISVPVALFWPALAILWESRARSSLEVNKTDNQMIHRQSGKVACRRH